MKTFLLSLLLLCVAQTGLAQHMVLDNATGYPLKNKHTKMAIQWATNRDDMQRENKAIIYGVTLDEKSLKIVNQTGKIKVDIPKNAGYFRILVWSPGKKKPDLLTNWVNIVQNKHYILHQDELAPAALVSGMGC